MKNKKKMDMRHEISYTAVVAFVLVIIFTTSPLFDFTASSFLTSAINCGHDYAFHFMRIEGLKDGILSGQFPVRIQPSWNLGYGYGVSIFYCDFFLIFPAVLRILGFSLINSYKAYVLWINAGTFMASYYCFKKMLKEKNIAILVSALYCLIPYRMTCIFVRTAVGEYTAMAFYPFVICGLWMLFSEESDLDTVRNSFYYLIFGYSGMVESHIISCVLAAILTCVVCVGNLKKMNKLRIIILGKVCITTFLINAWFLIPLIDFLKKVPALSQVSLWIKEFQYRGCSISNLFSLFAISDVCGNILQIVTILFFAFCVYSFRKNKNAIKSVEKRWLKLFAIGMLLFFFLSTKYFIWNILRENFGLFYKFAKLIQFPWRFLTLGWILLTCFVGLSIKIISKYDPNVYKYAIILIFFVLVSDILLQNSNYNYQNPETLKYNLYSQPIAGATDYLPKCTKILEIYNGDENIKISSNQLNVSQYQKKFLTISCICKNNGNMEEYIEVPLLLYSGLYVAESKDTKQNLEVAAGTNNQVRVRIPANFNGRIKVCVKKPILWRMAELVSLCSVLGICCMWYFKRKGRENANENDI